MVHAITTFQGILFNGPAAVVVFFIISGFCIHYPIAAGNDFDAPQFLVRRFLRIGLPLFAVVCISPMVGLRFEVLDRMAIWSLFCELIYYALYPAFRFVLRHVSWRVLLGCTFALALMVPLSELDHASRSEVNRTWGDYPSFGILKNSLLGLPCWLLGARLAQWWTQQLSSGTSPDTDDKLWQWRLGIWALSSIALVIRFHSPIGYPWTLNLFGIACYFWLQRELVHFAKVNPPSILEWGGTWSYSIYLVHPVTQAAWLGFALGASLPPLASWAMLMLATAVASYAFYRVVEAPSHSAAKAAARLMRTPLVSR